MEKRRPSITLSMIVKNEEKCLEKCLSSVSNFVDEIVIVDTGSTDCTKEIALKYTNKIYDYNWQGDFAAARNFSLSMATCDYILILDADEYIDNPIALIRSLDQSADCYLFKIQNILTNGSSYIHRAYRMIKNNIGLEFKSRLHEHINLSGFSNLIISESEAIIFHTGYLSDVFQEKEKASRNLNIIEEEVKSQPNDYNFYNLGRAQFTVSNYKHALESFKKSYYLNKDSVYLPDLLNKMAICLRELGRSEEGLKLVKDALDLFPKEVELLFNKGILCLNLDYIKDAKESFQGCLEIGDQGYQVTIGTGSYISKYKLAEIFEFSGMLSNAFQLIIDVMKEEKKFTLGLIKYFEITKAAKIPLIEIKKTLSAIHPINSVADLKSLLEVLYNERHPLLYDFLNQYSINVEKHIMAVAHLYTKRYAEALVQFREIDIIEEDNQKDILLLSFILKNESLLEGKLKLNLTKKEKSTLYKIIRREESITIKTEGKLASIIKDILTTLLDFGEDSQVEYLEEILINSSPKVIIFFAYDLVKQRHYAVAERVLKKLLMEKSLNVEALKLYGEIKTATHDVEESIELYEFILKHDKSYTVYERLYDLYEKNEEYNKSCDILEEIKARFPLVDWVRSEDRPKVSKGTVKTGGRPEMVSRDLEEMKLKLKANIEHFLEKGYIAEAKETIKEYEEIIPDDFDLYSLKGIVAISENNLERAESLFLDALSIKPFDNDILYNLAYLYQMQSKHISAFRTYKKLKKVADKILEKEIEKRIEELRVIKAVKEYEKRKKVLVVSYIFPPLGGSGVQRTLKFVKYLREFGWEPVVVTVGDGSNFHFQDNSLINEIPQEIEVLRINEIENIDENYIRELIEMYARLFNNQALTIEYIEELNKSDEHLKKLVLLPDQNILFAKEVLDKITDLIDFREIELIYTTSGPYSNHIVGYFLKDQFSKPWITDFRDEWTNNPYFHFDKNGLSYKIHRAMETSILNKSDQIIVVTPLSAENYIADFEVSPSKISTITNGYDENDFINLQSNYQNKEKFRIMHNGTFYMIRTPETFLKAVKNLIDKGLIDKHHLEINFTWTDNEEHWKSYVTNMSLDESVNFIGYLSHEESLRRAAETNLLLLVVGPGSKNKGVYTGKIFEYLRLGKPILALSPRGSIVEELISKTDRGSNCDFYDVESMEAYILERYNMWLRGESESLEVSNFIKGLERKQLTAKLAIIFDEFTSSEKNEQIINYDVSVKDMLFYDEVYENGGWNETYFKHYSETHYYPMWNRALNVINNGSERNVIDIGCGPGQFANLLLDNGITDYQGIDFSEEAIKVAKVRNDKYRRLFKVEDAYESEIFKGDYNVVILFEVLEHLDDDIKILKRIDSGSKVLFSVPNFYSQGHVRWFNSQFEVVERYKNEIMVHEVHVFNVGGNNKLYLVEGTKRDSDVE